MKNKILILCLFIFCVALIFAAGKKPPEKLKDGITTEGLNLCLASGQKAYTKFDAVLFAFSIYNEREKVVSSEKIFSDFVEPASAVALIAIDEEGTRYSGYAGNRTDPGEDYDHHEIMILPKKEMVFSFYHRDLRNSLFAHDKPFTALSDRVGTYTLHAQISKDIFKTKLPLVSNKITITITKK